MRLDSDRAGMIDDTNSVLDAVDGLRVAGIAVAPIGAELKRWQIGEALDDRRTIPVLEFAIAWPDVLIATKWQHAAAVAAERRRPALRTPRPATPDLTRLRAVAGERVEHDPVDLDTDSRRTVDQQGAGIFI